MTFPAPTSHWLSAIALIFTFVPLPAIAQITPDTTTGSTVTPDTIRGIPSDRITLSNGSQISSTVNPSAIGNAQQIILQTPRLRLTNSTLAAATNGTGNAGSIRINRADTISLNNSTLSTAINSGATANQPSNITLQTRSLSLTNGANITASTSGTGNAGNIRVRNADRINLNNSTISTAVNRNATGRGGNVTLQTDTLTVNNNARISAQTRGAGRAGSIRVNADRLTIANGGQFLTSTTTRRAGDITLNSDRLQIRGDRSGIFATTNAGSTGRGGDIAITGTDITLADGGAISTQTQGRGRAGNVQLQLNGVLRATNGTITTQSQQTAGGAIAIQARAIGLQGDSDIRTDVAQGENRGGDITLTADAILAFDDSDILAFARDGQGGNVLLNTPVFFGENYNPVPTGTNPVTLEGNDRVDVNASGRRNSGLVRLPDTSFIQNSLSNLPETAIDTDRLLANSCIARRQGTGSFLVTGGGSLPERPGQILLSPYPTGDVRSPIEVQKTTLETQGWQPGEAIVEPQGAYILPDGRIVLSRECS